MTSGNLDHETVVFHRLVRAIRRRRTARTRFRAKRLRIFETTTTHFSASQMDIWKAFIVHLEGGGGGRGQSRVMWTTAASARTACATRRLTDIRAHRRVPLSQGYTTRLQNSERAAFLLGVIDCRTFPLFSVCAPLSPCACPTRSDGYSSRSTNFWRRLHNLCTDSSLAHRFFALQDLLRPQEPQKWEKRALATVRLGQGNDRRSRSMRFTDLLPLRIRHLGTSQARGGNRGLLIAVVGKRRGFEREKLSLLGPSAREGG